MKTTICLILFFAFLSNRWVLFSEDQKPKVESPEGVREKIDQLQMPVRLGELPAVSLNKYEETKEEELKRINALIDKLAEIDSPEVGLSSTLSGQSFLPLPVSKEVDTQILTNHNLHQNEALLELVKLGPKSLPLLLKALDNNKPTKFTIKHDGMAGGGMWMATELWGNPANKEERKFADPIKISHEVPDQDIESYTVKIGDVCFVAIGQIVGRPYSAVRYQPTGCVVINSPTENEAFRKRIQAIWSSPNANKKLFESLILDYTTQGNFNGTSLDGWYVGSYLQCRAAMRLLYFFPAESTKLIAERLNGLDVKNRGDTEEWMKREVSNGVRATTFINAVSWCKEPILQTALNDLVKRTNDPEIKKTIRK
ncbi:MAG: hypothetical protein HY291_03415 [Planctomycetes bacterium]|nr:hypothetical protein [Planctomycetota bacterium]